MTRKFGAVLGLVAGLATLAAAGPASAAHVVLEPDPTTGIGQSALPPIATLNEPLLILGHLDRDDPHVNAQGEFTHTYSFGFDLAGEGGASATPNFLGVGTTQITGFEEFQGVVTLPGGGTVSLDPDGALQVPRTTRIAADFAALDTGGTTPYTLTITGRLLTGVTAGDYAGSIGVVPLPGAAVLFLTALGGLAFARRYRRRDEEGGPAAAAA